VTVGPARAAITADRPPSLCWATQNPDRAGRDVRPLPESAARPASCSKCSSINPSFREEFEHRPGARRRAGGPTTSKQGPLGTGSSRPAKRSSRPGFPATDHVVEYTLALVPARPASAREVFPDFVNDWLRLGSRPAGPCSTCCWGGKGTGPCCGGPHGNCFRPKDIAGTGRPRPATSNRHQLLGPRSEGISADKVIERLV